MRARKDQAALPLGGYWGEEKKSAERALSEGPRSMRTVNNNLAAPILPFERGEG